MAPENAHHNDQHSAQNNDILTPGSPLTPAMLLPLYAANERDDTVFLQAVADARISIGNEALYEPMVMRRMAKIRLNSPSVYQGTILGYVGDWLPKAWRDWDRKIESYSLAMGELDIVPLSSIAPEEIHWLWYPYIPLRKLTMVEGDPAGGKTYLLLALAAGISKGYALPDQKGKVDKANPGDAGNTLYITAEDGLADTIRPRADKLGADTDRIFVPRTPQSFSLAEPQALSNAMERFKPRLLVLDPIQAFLGGDLDMHRANEVRPIMTTLLSLAIEHDCAIIAVRHWTKAAGSKAKHRGQGNVDFTAAARSVLAVGESPEDDSLRIMAQAKASLAALGTSIVFKLNDDGLQWCGTSELTADELSQAQPTRHKEQRKDAMEWLRDTLQGGPILAKTVIEMADAVGISEKTLRGAREKLHILLMRKGKGPSYWKLPTHQEWERYPGEEDGDEIF